MFLGYHSPPEDINALLVTDKMRAYFSKCFHIEPLEYWCFLPAAFSQRRYFDDSFLYRPQKCFLLYKARHWYIFFWHTLIIFTIYMVFERRLFLIIVFMSFSILFIYAKALGHAFSLLATQDYHFAAGQPTRTWRWYIDWFRFHIGLLRRLGSIKSAQNTYFDIAWFELLPIIDICLIFSTFIIYWVSPFWYWYFGDSILGYILWLGYAIGSFASLFKFLWAR